MAATTIKTLTMDAHCGFCRGVMKAGDPFRWYLKSGVRGGSRAGGTKDRYVPVHHDPDTCRAINHAPSAVEIEAKARLDARLEEIRTDFDAGAITAERAVELAVAAISGR